jgi:hypothetical protein
MLEWAINGSALHVPALWTWEILNAVGVVIRRRRISSDRGQAFLEQLAALNFKIDLPHHLLAFSEGSGREKELRGHDTYPLS